jgi:hypothetical protein
LRQEKDSSVFQRSEELLLMACGALLGAGEGQKPQK